LRRGYDVIGTLSSVRDARLRRAIHALGVRRWHCHIGLASQPPPFLILDNKRMGEP
jgi:hypothetical protein